VLGAFSRGCFEIDSPVCGREKGCDCDGTHARSTRCRARRRLRAAGTPGRGGYPGGISIAHPHDTEPAASSAPRARWPLWWSLRADLITRRKPLAHGSMARRERFRPAGRPESASFFLPFSVLVLFRRRRIDRFLCSISISIWFRFQVGLNSLRWSRALRLRCWLAGCLRVPRTALESARIESCYFSWNQGR